MLFRLLALGHMFDIKTAETLLYIAK